MYDSTPLGERIASARENRGYSAPQLAQRLGVKSSSVDRWESGETAPRANHLNHIAGLLNVPLVWLIAGEGNSQETNTPVFVETGAIDNKIARAEALLAELGGLLKDIRTQAHRLESNIDHV